MVARSKKSSFSDIYQAVMGSVDKTGVKCKVEPLYELCRTGTWSPHHASCHHRVTPHVIHRDQDMEPNSKPPAWLRAERAFPCDGQQGWPWARCRAESWNFHLEIGYISLPKPLSKVREQKSQGASWQVLQSGLSSSYSIGCLHLNPACIDRERCLHVWYREMVSDEVLTLHLFFHFTIWCPAGW